MKAKIIGCGITGIVAAILLREKGYEVEIFDERNHIGGNCYDSNINGVLVHNYGPHIFHTNDDEVWEFVNRYSEFKHFKLAPKGVTNIGTISLPYSLTTIQELGRELSSQEIIDLIFRDYSEKQWGVPFEQVGKAILSRVHTAKTTERPSWYNNEKYEGIPKNGYTIMMQNMLDGIKVHLDIKNNEWKNIKSDLTVYTGKVDAYFNYCHGHLPYRSLVFEHSVTNKRLDWHMYNQCNKNVDYTRIYDHSYFLDQKEIYTVVTKEFPIMHDSSNIPFYPITFGEGQTLYSEYYKPLTNNEKNVLFLGRLATYKYLDMWVAIKQVLNALRKI